MLTISVIVFAALMAWIVIRVYMMSAPAITDDWSWRETVWLLAGAVFVLGVSWG